MMAIPANAVSWRGLCGRWRCHDPALLQPVFVPRTLGVFLSSEDDDLPQSVCGLCLDELIRSNFHPPGTEPRNPFLLEVMVLCRDGSWEVPSFSASEVGC